MAVPTLLDRAPSIRRLRRRFERAPWAGLVEVAARAGYLARGAVHVSVGIIALLAALDLTPRAEGAAGALEGWGRWPAGLVLLWLVGAGLFGFAAWRGLQAVFDADRQGRSAKAVLARIGQAISGTAYAVLGFTVFSLIDALEEFGEAEDGEGARAAAAAALELPYGGLLVIAAGLFIFGSGIGSMVRAIVDHFGRSVSRRRDTRLWAGILARIGYFGRGVALLPLGLFVTAAGLRARASEARGLGDALQALEAQPLGGPVLALAGVGLIAFGLFAAVEGWARPMQPEAALDGP